ncbi:MULTISPECIES: FmdE family protein [Dehalobacter]|jgi:formylmethanofuran dehydrogenase subunit E|uniref:Formylmethanofuran dehydrogenase subunit E n=1 Tax=Dehalobacter restrictus (strain DSM 9455 / PER-K23) TaxID=871738 RepID=A0ABN4BUV1_DEHRP|nr:MULTISPECIES: FmdE family protein [Dehalobacter]AHF09496.1 formylmethanofuran dehydrogenase subunit E [Dehalobacter restrictus DSM 9455]MCG1026044.1 formylmethanofuran dehydrogenase [Dehalobacter sp.]MDJ0304771.1 FmdE family protein [Dehalobacter sp.]OCZ50447.1 formylmethanofuran dehydrogenase [Dehalobacter sp. TeCB1]
MCREKTPWEKCAEFHGHECMGLAIGFRQAFIGLDALGVVRAADEELFAVVENDACGVDAIQVLTGCTLGKGNLIYKDSGKQAVTLANRKSGKAVRILRKRGNKPDDEQYTELKAKISAGTASEQEKIVWGSLQKERIEKFLAAPAAELFTVTEVAMPRIEPARIFQTVVCSQCGEPFAEVKAHLVGGKIICSDCNEAYTRGWR